MVAKRIIDIVFALVASGLLLVVFLVIAALIKCTSRGPVLHWSERTGQLNRTFCMPKFRTMCIDTPVVAAHLLDDPARYLTPIGRFLRKTSLDELPQLWCIVTGDMSLVGPRPVVLEEQDLIKLRTEKGVHQLRPGLTGWAQVNGRDALDIITKVRFDEEYLQMFSLKSDFKIILLTVLKVLRCEDVSH
ncbi:MAG: sugar transferase [Pseudomonadota bacterium]